MRIIGTHIRSCILTAVGLIAAIVVGYGCAHSDLGPLDPIQVPGGFEPGGGKDTRTIGVTLGEIGVHSIEIDFSFVMDFKTVEAVVKNETGAEMQNIVKYWPANMNSIVLKGPFEFCRYYEIILLAGAETVNGLRLEQDMTLSAEMIKNPLDVDQSGTCTADFVVDPVFTDGPDVAVIIGDTVSSQRPYEEKSRADIDKGNTFYIDYSNYHDYAGRMIRVPEMLRDGSTGLAKLFFSRDGIVRHYTLDLWAQFDPLRENPTSSIIHDISGNSTDLLGPVDGGDLDGDGTREILLSVERRLNGGSVFQTSYILKGPVPYGDELPLSEIAYETTRGVIGKAFSPFYAVGDIDGDGRDDLATIYNEFFSTGSKKNWQVWIYYGNDSIERTLQGLVKDTIYGRGIAPIVDVDGGDVNGDGLSDLIITEIEGLYVSGRYKDAKPHVEILFGKRELNGRKTYEADVDIFWKNKEDTFVSTHVLGDLNGDGFNDIGIFVEEEDIYGKTVSSTFYVMAGRDTWFDIFSMSFPLNKFEILKINTLGYNVSLEDDNPAIGDINNDGYYDFMVTGDDGINRTAYFFFGGEKFSKTDIDLDEADVIWMFKNP